MIAVFRACLYSSVECPRGCRCLSYFQAEALRLLTDAESLRVICMYHHVIVIYTTRFQYLHTVLGTKINVVVQLAIKGETT